MKLKTRAALIPIIATSVLTLGLYLLVSAFTIKGFTKIEHEVLHRQVERVVNSFAIQSQEHSQKLVDWAQWDRTYEFMSSKESEYIEVTLNPLTLEALSFDSVMYFRPDLTLYHGVSLEGDSVQDVSRSEEGRLRELLGLNSGSQVSGLAYVNGELRFIASAPIVPNSGADKSRGILVATSKVTPVLLESIGHLTRLNLTFWQENDESKPSFLNDLSGRLGEGSSFELLPLSNEKIYAAGSVRDLAGKPSLFFAIEDGRHVVQSGYSVQKASMLMLLASGLIATLLLVLVINYSATRRINEFASQVRKIASDYSLKDQIVDQSKSSRSLRLKTAGGLLGVFVLVTAITSYVFNNNFINGFMQIEDQVMQDNLERATRALKGRLDKIQAKTIDWAQWDDTYNFVADSNKDYVQDNLGFDTLGSMEIDYVIYLDSYGEVVTGKRVSKADQWVDKTSSLENVAFSNLSRSVDVSKPFSGFLDIDGRAVLFGASPILNSDRTADSRGVMIFGVVVDSKLAQAIGEQTRLTVEFDSTKGAPTVSSRGMNISRPLASDLIVGTSYIEDYSEKPILSVRVTSTQPLLVQGRRVAQLIPIYFMLGGLLCAILTAIVVDRVILSRLSRLGKEVASIKKVGTDTRIESSGNDEISGLASDINSMLKALRETQTELAAAKQVAEAANQVKSQFIARVSHELRNPLAGIIGINDLLLRKHVNTPATKDLVRRQGMAAEEVLGIVNEILDFSTIEKGKLVFEEVEFSPRAVIKEAFSVVSGRLLGNEKENSLRLICDVSPNVPSLVVGDPTKLKHVLVNLMGNSVKFTESGNVGLRAWLEPGITGSNVLGFEIWDTGIGIAKSKIDKIFEPFTQADESITRRYQGTGLGLTIVKQIVEARGGVIRVDSEEGIGSKFYFRMPFEIKEHSRWLNSTGEEIGQVTLIGASSIEAHKHLSDSLEAYGLSVSRMAGEVSEIDWDSLSDSNYILISEEAFSKEGLNDLPDLLAVMEGRVAAIVNLSNVELLESLYANGLKTIYSPPVAAWEVVELVEGKIDPAGGRDDVIVNPLTEFSPLRVLLADDSVTNRMIVTELLEEAGHTVISGENGKELLDHLLPQLMGHKVSEVFDIAITDISMPIMDGYTVAKRIRTLEQEKGRKNSFPLLAISAHALTQEKQRMLAAGVDGVLTKPVRADAMAEELKRLLPRTRLKSFSKNRLAKGEAVAERTPPKKEETIIVVTADDLERYAHQLLSGKDWSELTDDLKEVLDVSDLYSRVGNSLKRTGAVCRAFDGAIDEAVSKLQEAKEKHSLRALGKAGHSLKGLLLDVGAVALGKKAASVEDLCKASDFDGAEPHIDPLIQGISELRPIVQSISVKLNGV